jgi:hypothetical protein
MTSFCAPQAYAVALTESFAQPQFIRVSTLP